MLTFVNQKINRMYQSLKLYRGFYGLILHTWVQMLCYIIVFYLDMKNANSKLVLFHMKSYPQKCEIVPKMWNCLQTYETV